MRRFMDYYLLTDLAVQMGYELAMSGAETFRVEDTIGRILKAYGIDCEVFAIPNCLTISFEAGNGKPLTRMKRIGYHGNNLEAVERLNAMSRKICAEKPDPKTAMQWLADTKASCRVFSPAMYYLGNFCGAAGFSLVFGGSLLDFFWAGILGLIIGAVNRLMSGLKSNHFFSTIIAAFLMAAVAYPLAGAKLITNVDAAIIGALMILVPGLLITNSMRDIIYGDTNSGINRIVQVLLTAFAIALGTAAAWHVTSGFYGMNFTGTSYVYPFWVQGIAVLIGCIGFAILFNVHGWGSWLCTIGGTMTWMVYLLAQHLGLGIFSMNLLATVFAAAYSESMARIRKYPAISYLVVSIFPLLPGAGIYYTMSLGLAGNMSLAVSKGMETAGIAGSIAVGILLVSTFMRLLTEWLIQRRRKG